MISLPRNGRFAVGMGLIVILGLITLVYWPVSHAGFVWVDKIIFHDTAWLRVGDDWKRFVFHNFYEWVNYFRPLVVAFFVLEVRVFDVAPEPMHWVSLMIHLANTVLVGALAMRITPITRLRDLSLAGIVTLFYGLHPALIEPVVWISCQFELIVTFFTLLALLANISIKTIAARTALVSLCFLLAAFSKESAVVLPPLLLILDIWCSQEEQPGIAWRPLIITTISRQWPVYLCILIVGFIYLLARNASLGVIAHSNGQIVFFSLAHLQEICSIYLNYWRILLWPMQGLGPIHVVNGNSFATLTWSSFCIDAIATAMWFAGVYLVWKRNIVGLLILCVTLCLIPVLHVIPISFDESLFHERYAMLALAVAAFISPSIFIHYSPQFVGWRLVTVCFVAAFWLAIAVLNIRITLPLWSDETRLWQWVLRDHPDSVTAQSHLFSTYLENDDRVEARRLAEKMLADRIQCQMCMVNIAYLASADGDAGQAVRALDEAKRLAGPQPGTGFIQAYILATGQVREVQKDFSGAEEAYRDASTMEPMDPQPYMNLALLLVREKKIPAARETMEHALLLFAPDEREKRRDVFEKAVVLASAAND